MSQVNTNSIYDASGGSNAVLYGVAAPANSMGFRNRIINGAMVIDQRNAGASVSGSGFSVDRFYNAFTSTNATQQRSTTAPQGFTNSLLVTVTTATAPGSSSLAYISQTIEGFNVADMDFGKSTAVTFTLSFWVRSSLTGTYAIGLLNGAQDRSYVATYTISSANTWEYKTVTVAGDTGGTWLTDNGKGLCVFWDLGSGSNYQATAGSWQAGTFLRTSGSNNFANTLGATFYITGVQLEAGSVASPFERRDYGRELIMCQRYYCKSYNVDVVPGTVTTAGEYQTVSAGGVGYLQFVFPVMMRTTPTMTYFGPRSGGSGVFNTAQTTSTASVVQNATGQTTAWGGASVSSGNYVEGHFTASAEL